MKNFKQEFQTLLGFYKKKNFYKAELLSKRLINIYPENIVLYNILGLILNQQNKNDEAIECYEKGLKIDPKFSMIYNNLGSIYRSRNQLEKAESYFKKSIDLNNKLAEPLNNLGNLYKSMNNYEDAIKCYNKAISINPNFFAFHYNLAIAYKSIGQFSKAEKHLNDCLNLNKYFFTAHRNLSELIKYTNESKHLSILNELYNENKIDKKNKKELAFALGKAHDDIKNYSKSFNYYNEGNKLHRSTIKFSIKHEKQEFELIKKTFNKDLFTINQDTNNLKDEPIFIIGMPRSGTSLVEQIISTHSQVFGGDELNLIPDIIKNYFTDNESVLKLEMINEFKSQKLKDIGHEYLNNIKKISKNLNRTTDKLPINFKWIGLIKLIIPKAKIIHCVRNPKDTCTSIFKNFFTSSELSFAYDIDEIVEYYNLYYNLMSYWKDNLPNFIIDIRYENLINYPQKEIKNLIKDCNLVWEEKCLEFYKNTRPILTASDTQARKKIYKSSLDSWKRYEKNLKTSFDKLISQ